MVTNRMSTAIWKLKEIRMLGRNSDNLLATVAYKFVSQRDIPG